MTKVLLYFGSSINPITTRGADYAHHITASPPGFENLAASLFSHFPNPLELQLQKKIFGILFWQGVQTLIYTARAIGTRRTGCPPPAPRFHQKCYSLFQAEGGGRLSPSHYYLPSQFFRPSYDPAMLCFVQENKSKSPFKIWFHVGRSNYNM